jgi:aldose 1-epimerase
MDMAQENKFMTQVKLFKKEENGTAFFEMKSSKLRVIVTNLGCHILSIFAQDRNGNGADVVLGYENIEDCHTDGSYMGAVVGRVANRIGQAAFELNHVIYTLVANNGENHLHGGKVGFNQRWFDYQILNDGIQFHYLSPDMEEGYPGNLDFIVTYQLLEDTLCISYDAICDRDTIVNFTNHSYFNLSGGQEKIDTHKLFINADRIACVDENCLANGEFLSVEGTPFDFKTFHEIGERINEQHIQLVRAGGYDHAFLLNESEEQIVLIHEKSGRKLTISTDMPTVQVYSGNFLDGGCNGKTGKPYGNRDGVALETQLLPNSIHIEKQPGVILKKGQKFKSKTTYCFSQC